MTAYKLYTTATPYWIGSGPVSLNVSVRLSIDGVDTRDLNCWGYSARASDLSDNSAAIRTFSTIDSNYVVEMEYELVNGDTLEIVPPHASASYGNTPQPSTSQGCCEVSEFPFKVTVPANTTTVPDFNLPAIGITGGFTGSNGWTPGQTVTSSKFDSSISGLKCNGTITDAQPLEIYYPGWGAGAVYNPGISKTDVTYCFKITFKAKSGTVINVNIAGVWKESKPYVNVSGSWKEVQEGYVNVNGTWKEIT